MNETLETKLNGCKHELYAPIRTYEWNCGSVSLRCATCSNCKSDYTIERLDNLRLRTPSMLPHEQ